MFVVNPNMVYCVENLLKRLFCNIVLVFIRDEFYKWWHSFRISRCYQFDSVFIKSRFYKIHHKSYKYIEITRQDIM